MATAEAVSDVVVNKRIGQICAVTLLVTAGALMSCQTKLSKLEQGVIDTPIVCLNFKPISWVESDSKKTRAQINAHNATWDEYCKEKESE